MLKSPALLLLLAMAIAGAGSLFGSTTRAQLTDVSQGTGTFATASVNLALASSANCAGGTYSEAVGAVMNVSGQGPGSISTGAICIKNEGSVPAQWSLAGSVSDDAGGGLESVMKIRFWSLNATGSTNGTACANGFTASGAAVALSSGGQANFGADLYNSAGSIYMSADPSIAASGSTQIAVAGFMKLCFTVVLPDSVSDPALQNKAVTVNSTITGN